MAAPGPGAKLHFFLESFCGVLGSGQPSAGLSVGDSRGNRLCGSRGREKARNSCFQQCCAQAISSLPPACPRPAPDPDGEPELS